MDDLDGLKILGLETVFNNYKILEIINEATKIISVDKYVLGGWYRELNLIPQAKKAYHDAIIQKKYDIDLHYDIGNTFQELGDSNSAIEFLKKALELAKKNKVDANYLSSIYHNLAFAYSHKENSTNETIEFYKKAIIEDPMLSLSYSNLGIIYEAEEKFEDAMGFYSSAFRLGPYTISFINQMAFLYNRLDDNEKAISFLKPMVENLPELHSALSSIYCDIGEFEKAIKEGEAALKLDNKSPFNHRQLGYNYVGKNLINEASDKFDESLQLGPNLRYTYAAKAGCFKRLKKIDEYHDLVKFALQLPLEQGENEYNEASFEALCGNTKEALNLLKVALQKKQRTPAYVSRDWDFQANFYQIFTKIIDFK